MHTALHPEIQGCTLYDFTFEVTDAAVEIAMTKILNLTQHVATPDQIAAGIVEPALKAAVQLLITFDELPGADHLRDCAMRLSALALADPSYDGVVMIGGAPYFMAPLERALRVCGIRTLYAFAKRESVDVAQADGSIKKTQVFRHAGFVEVSD